jgi:hypothetical protein
MSAVVESRAPALSVVSSGWLRSSTFDANFIGLSAGLAMLTGLASMYDPAIFRTLLFLDLWLLGYHHVVSTFTRLVFDRKSL